MEGGQAVSLHLQEIESLQNSLREREKYVTELENRLRALWDKLEGERKCHLEHLRLQEEHLSEIERENERLNNHIRQLERELNEANKTISLQHELMTTAEKRGVDKAKEELNEAKDRIKRLEEAGDRMAATHLEKPSYESALYDVCAWNKAKEAKP